MVIVLLFPLVYCVCPLRLIYVCAICNLSFDEETMGALLFERHCIGFVWFSRVCVWPLGVCLHLWLFLKRLVMNVLCFYHDSVSADFPGLGYIPYFSQCLVFFNHSVIQDCALVSDGAGKLCHESCLKEMTVNWMANSLFFFFFYKNLLMQWLFSNVWWVSENLGSRDWTTLVMWSLSRHSD